jgi:type I restriction enzyme R subunit
VQRDELPVEIQQNIDMESYRLQQMHSGKIKLERGAQKLPPITGGVIFDPPPQQVEPLSAILKKLNERFGTDFSEEDKVFIKALEERLAGDAALGASIKVNTPENARLTFDHVASDKIQELIDTNFKLYKQINDNEEFAEFFFDWLFERYSGRETEGN